MSATPANPVIVECELPLQTSLDRDFVKSAYFFDSYRTLLTQPSLRMVDIFFSLFGHHPLWMKSALILRHRLVALFGLDAPKSSAVMKFERKSDYAVGDPIGVWSIFVLTETELIAD